MVPCASRSAPDLVAYLITRIAARLRAMRTHRRSRQRWREASRASAVWRLMVGVCSPCGVPGCAPGAGEPGREAGELKPLLRRLGPPLLLLLPPPPVGVTAPPPPRPPLGVAGANTPLLRRLLGVTGANTPLLRRSPNANPSFSTAFWYASMRSRSAEMRRAASGTARCRAQRHARSARRRLSTSGRDAFGRRRRRR